MPTTLPVVYPNVVIDLTKSNGTPEDLIDTVMMQALKQNVSSEDVILMLQQASIKQRPSELFNVFSFWFNLKYPC